MKTHQIPAAAYEAARVIHTRTEKVSESLTWAASRLAPPAPPIRLTSDETTIKNIIAQLYDPMSGPMLQQHPAAHQLEQIFQPLSLGFNYNAQYLEYVSLYETYLGHLRRLEKVHSVLGRSTVSMSSGSPLKPGPNDPNEKEFSKPGFGLVATPFPPSPPSAKNTARIRAKRARQRAAKRTREALKRATFNAAVTEELSSQIKLAKAQSVWTKVERKGKRSALPRATPQVVPPTGGRPPPSSGNRKARRYAIYGVPTQTK